MSTSILGRGLRSLSGWDAAAIIEIGKVLTSFRYKDEILQTIHEKIDELLHPDAWSLLLVDEAKQELYVELIVGQGAEAVKDVRIKIGENAEGWVAQHNQTVVIADFGRGTDLSSKMAEKTEIDGGSMVFVPMRHRDRCLGIIELTYSIGSETLSQSDVSLLEALADFAGIAIGNANYIRRTNIEALKSNHYEARNFIIEAEIYRSEIHSYQFSIISICLGRFSDVSDTIFDVRGAFESCGLGIKITNEHFESKTLGDLDSPTLVFWLGETECIVVLPQTSKDTACNIALQMSRDWMSNNTFAGEELADWKKAQESSWVTMGVATFPEDARTREDLVQSAYKALKTVWDSGSEGVAAANIGVLPLDRPPNS
jgi:putative methionine-R-sulfoxide reductase with GAF domain